MKSIPTVVVWDQDMDAVEEDEVMKRKGGADEDEEDEDVWEGMENVGDDDGESDEGTKRKGRSKKSRTKQ